MERRRRRTKLLFDGRARLVYPVLINYNTLDDARADVPRIAEALRISAKSIGGHLTQANTNPGVAAGLLRIGYDESQIPNWFAWPEKPPSAVVGRPTARSSVAPQQPARPAPPRQGHSWGEEDLADSRGYVSRRNDWVADVNRRLREASIPTPFDVIVGTIQEATAFNALMEHRYQWMNKMDELKRSLKPSSDTSESTHTSE